MSKLKNNNKQHYYTTILLSFFIITVTIKNLYANNKITITPSIKFYNEYIFSNELQFNFEYNTNNNFTFGANIKQSSIDNNTAFNFLNGRNNRIQGLESNNKNYFYKLYLSGLLYNINNKNHNLYYTLFYNDNIKYNDLLKFTYINEIYNSIGIKINYLNNKITNNNLLINNIFLSYTKNLDNVKDNVEFGFSLIPTIFNNIIDNKTINFSLNYKYSKDIKLKDNLQIEHNYRLYNVKIKDLLYTYHDINLNTIIKVYDVADINIDIGYLFNHKMKDGIYCNFGLSW